MISDFLIEVAQSKDFNFIYEKHKRFLWECILKYYKIEREITSKIHANSHHDKIREIIVRSVLGFLQSDFEF